MASEPAVAFAPGRVNLIGEHTDYNLGLALPFAIAEGVTVRAWPLSMRRVEAVALDLDEADRFDLDNPERVPGWRAFVRGAVAELARRDLAVGGARLEIAGDVPRGSGLASSAALTVAICLALLGARAVARPAGRTLAEICSLVENEWVGARTGLLDQLASIYGEADRALRMDFRSFEIRPVALDLDDWRFVTLDSGERHANAASGYNRRRAECAEAGRQLGIGSLRDASRSMLDRLPHPLGDRARHVIDENARVDQTAAALERRDLEAVGRLLDRSHASLRDLYDVSTPAVEATVDRLKAAGAAGARVVGGGFGGHVLALLPSSSTAPDGAREVRPGPGARLVSEATT
jgi:galactokinase